MIVSYRYTRNSKLFFYYFKNFFSPACFDAGSELIISGNTAVTLSPKQVFNAA